MKRIIRLTESDLARIVKRVINEQPLMKLDFVPSKKTNNATYTGSKEGDIKFFQK